MKTTPGSEHFLTEYEKLNPQQRSAVDQVEGPVLVIAGPGTGKTQILAARIAHILQSTDALPENILCLTYTDAGTVAMRKRLLQFIGPDAYRVAIYTFHAFCNLVIQENLDYFGLRSLDAISELEQVEYVHDIIDKFPKDHPLKRYTGDIYYETRKLLNLYENMKREHWTAEYLRSKVDAYIDDLPNREAYIYKKATKTAKAGDLKQKEYDAEVKRMTQLKAAADTFEQYQEVLKKNNRYDFADMILWVIDAFRTKPELLSNYQEQYQYFLVDEYQDTSGAQNELLQLLLDYWNKPNIFCVGDDDQSIYRFQGANVENIRQFIQKYQSHELRTVSLRENYRSTQYILDAAKALISENTTRIDPDKTLVAMNAQLAKLPIQPAVRAYYNAYHEAAGIAHEIQQLIADGVALNEIAVLYRKHAQAEDMIKYLQSMGIAVNTKRRSDALQEVFIKKLVQILKYLSAEISKAHSGEQFIYEILHYDFFHIPPVEIARLAVNVSRKNFNERATSWREEIRNAVRTKPADLFTPVISTGNEMAYASKVLEGWISDAVNLTTQQLVERVITESGMLAHALSGADKTWHMQLLHTFFDFVKSEGARNPKTPLKSLLHTIDLMVDEGIGLPVQKISYAENGVNFITAHSSKGLEFEYVYMIGCTTKAWEKSATFNEFKLPDNLFEIQTEDDAEESRRLFYVAMTRAKKQLVVSFPERDASDKDLEKSRFVAELETHAAIPVQSFHATDDMLANFQLAVLQASPRDMVTADLFDNEFVDELLEKYSLSVTHLNNYLKCPTAFYFNNLIRVPAPMSASMTFGSAVHYALEMLFRNMNAHAEKQFAPVEEVVKDFKWYMRRNEDGFTDTEFKRRIEYGEDILPKFYARYINEWNKITSVERSYRNVVMEEVPLNGKLDKLEFDGTVVNVVDYKTGQFERSKYKFGPPDEEKKQKSVDEGKEVKFEDEFGGDYWRQAVFYKILIDYDQTKNWEMRTCEFDFVEPDQTTKAFIKQRVAIAPSDVEIVKKQIVSTYRNIKAKSFSDGCGKETCTWCTFVKTYYHQPGAVKPVHPPVQEED